jgi:uncharacterized protein (DUF1330 family)
MDVHKMIEDFGNWYGDGTAGGCPRAEQWARVLERDPTKPVALINFFKLRETAVYVGDQVDQAPISGQDAFSRYAEVSIPTMERVGGKFLLVAPFEGSFIGQDEDWDLVAIGSYPNLQAFLDLYQDAKYRSVYHHRTAACEKQKVLISAA